MHYILKDKLPIRVKDVVEWAKWFKNDVDRVVKQDRVGKILISTVFLGLDHNFMMDKPFPLLFETMIFGGEYDDYKDRYISWDEAETGHRMALELVKSTEEILKK